MRRLDVNLHLNICSDVCLLKAENRHLFKIKKLNLHRCSHLVSSLFQFDLQSPLHSDWLHCGYLTGVREPIRFQSF